VTETIEIVPLNESYSTVLCSESVTKEIRSYLTFEVPGAKFSPAYRAKHWNGTVCMMDRNNKILRGLTETLISWAAERKYDLVHHEDEYELSLTEALSFIESLNLPIEPRDYQVAAFVKAIRRKRRLILSATSSGKSLIIYLISRYLYEKNLARNLLVVVPTTSLVSQLTSDFGDYGCDTETFVQQIQEGCEKTIHKPVVISTWQSIQYEPKSYFEQFDSIIGDEAHLAGAKKLTYIISNCGKARWRIGLTGTLKDSKVHKLTLEGLFGRPYKASTAKSLMDKGHIANFEIKALRLKYGAAEAISVLGKEYRDEIDFLIGHEGRNRFITNLALSMETNTLVLFKYVEKHGLVLVNLLDRAKTDFKRKIFYVHGGTESEDREEIRRLVEKEKNCIIVASMGVFSTGVNIKNLHNIIFASPSKARVTILQSIGRGLRLSPNKEKAVLYDIADDLRHKGKKNYTYNHFLQRLQIYTEEQFPFKIYDVRLNK
jgi:superfamily II DNA or RNA helicase